MRSRPQSIRRIICSIVLVGCCNAFDSGTLKGVVTDSAGAVIPGALVRVERWKTNDARQFFLANEIPMYTGTNGEFSRLLPPGIYDVFISGALFSPVAKKVKIESNKVTMVSPQLQYDPLIDFVY
jgi:hypothetical protein